LILSVLGVALLLLGSIFSSPDPGAISESDKLIVGGAFITSCLIGFSLALRPNWIRGIIKDKKGNIQNPDSNSTKRIRIGHHPDCKGFDFHIIKTNKQTLCAGCLGLAIGSVLGIVMTFIYIFNPIIMDYIPTISMIIFGLVFIGLNFISVAIMNKNTTIHVMSNAVLVLGFFLVVMGAYGYSGKMEYGILAVIISFLWLDTRIQLSHWHHNKICYECDDLCKAYCG
jgi:uncharacterized membrane protein